MKTLMTIVVATLSLAAAGTASAQYASMMNGGSGGMWADGWMGGPGGAWMGGYGGIGGPILLAVVVGLVVWIVTQKPK